MNRQPADKSRINRFLFFGKIRCRAGRTAVHQYVCEILR